MHRIPWGVKLVMNNKYAAAVEIFRKNNGILRRSEAIRLGILEHQIYSMLTKGILVKEDRGIYRLAELEPLGNPDLIQVSLLIPKAVISLISALYFHRLTSQMPYEVFISLPRNVAKPRVSYPPLSVVWQAEKPFQAGIQTHILDGVSVKIYNPEKTITDCFKFRAKVGTEVAIEALKDYMRLPQPKISRLLEYARINRVENLIKPYLETLI